MKIMIADISLQDNTHEDDIKAFRQLGAEDAFLSLDPELLERADGLVLPGSPQDINPALWGEEPAGSQNVNDELDRMQRLLTDMALERQIPVLGICRGMQFLNIYFGGSLYQDLVCKPAHVAGERAETEGLDRYHVIETSEGSFLSKLFGPEAVVNTWHHQGIRVLGEELSAVGTWRSEKPDESGESRENREEEIVEAFVHETFPIVGYQWHPERMFLYGNEKQRADGAAALRYFLEMCR